MTKQYKVLKVSSNWSLEKLRLKIEETLNSYSRQGWELASINYIDGTYAALITIFK